ncbi:hypothetical protein EDD18DRAFT_1467096 [Armillaria luteobubalina]|uniref:Uncharacterized protein n=1 Tax=Armillaria luteobubalina TaxID=153913 RepID=A0AA39UDR2_9AGAR|nr:hypothetical protein EDD18DRAFT_1467096 [Armillaria luteobubalina]
MLLLFFVETAHIDKGKTRVEVSTSMIFKTNKECTIALLAMKIKRVLEEGGEHVELFHGLSIQDKFCCPTLALVIGVGLIFLSLAFHVQIEFPSRRTNIMWFFTSLLRVDYQRQMISFYDAMKARADSERIKILTNLSSLLVLLPCSLYRVWLSDYN